jgi:hypothetical protein
MISIPLLLLAIAQVETGDATHPHGNDAAIGKHGERSRYQITERVWRQHMGSNPFTWATNRPDIATAVAHVHVKRLIEYLPQGRGKDVIWVAIAWHSGVTRASTGRFRSTAHAKESLEYATRVKNIYDELLKKPCQTSLKQSPRKARTAK